MIDENELIEFLSNMEGFITKEQMRIDEQMNSPFTDSVKLLAEKVYNSGALTALNNVIKWVERSSQQNGSPLN